MGELTPVEVSKKPTPYAAWVLCYDDTILPVTITRETPTLVDYRDDHGNVRTRQQKRDRTRLFFARKAEAVDARLRRAKIEQEHLLKRLLFAQNRYDAACHRVAGLEGGADATA